VLIFQPNIALLSHKEITSVLVFNHYTRLNIESQSLYSLIAKLFFSQFFGNMFAKKDFYRN